MILYVVVDPGDGTSIDRLMTLRDSRADAGRELVAVVATDRSGQGRERWIASQRASANMGMVALDTPAPAMNTNA
jgi:hypothetical protein